MPLSHNLMMTMNKSTGRLFLIPTQLSDESFQVIPSYVKELLNTFDNFVVENEKSARHFLKKAGYTKSLNEVRLTLLNEHTSSDDVGQLLSPLLEGKDLGLLSEAGCPAVADPGASLVMEAQHKNIEVIPLVGPSSIILSLMASGLNGQSFSFAGYIPKDRSERVKSLRELEKAALMKNQTQIFIEAPYRNQHLLEDILQTCDKNTMLCIACEITGSKEFIKTKSVAEWRKKIPDINKRPTIFLIGR
jgi:16S rRNA (cytidine1402-2'-O)-methyltransferase